MGFVYILKDFDNCFKAGSKYTAIKRYHKGRETYELFDVTNKVQIVSTATIFSSYLDKLVEGGFVKRLPF